LRKGPGKKRGSKNRDGYNIKENPSNQRGLGPQTQIREPRKPHQQGEKLAWP